MTDLITSFLKNLGCSYCQEYNFEDNKTKFSLWKMYLKEYEMYSSIHLYNNESKKDISEKIKKNDVISLFDFRLVFDV